MNVSNLSQTSRISLRTYLQEKELWLLIALVLAFFYRPLFAGETFFERDLYLHFFLRKQIFVDFFHAHIWPLWNPYLQGGQPYIAELSNSVLYPTNFLFLVFPFLTACNLHIVVHFLACAVCAYLAARVIGLGSASSLLSGIIYGFCGYTLSLGNLLGLLMAMPYLPLLLLCWHCYLRENRKRWFSATVILGVFQVFAGAPELNVLTLLFLGGWTVCYPYAQSVWWKRGGQWVLLGACILLLASVQIFPTIEMILQSPRGEGLSFLAFSHWSLYPERLPELVLPGFLGYAPETGMAKELYWWGGKLLQEPRPYIYSIYIGGLVMLLAMLGALRQRAAKHLPLRARLFLSATVALGLLLALGRHLPLMRLIYSVMPLLSLFRHPIKFLFVAIFPISLLAGYGAEISFGKSSSTPSLKFMNILWAILIGLLVLTSAFWLSAGFAIGCQQFFFKYSAAFMRLGILRLLLHCALIWFLGCLLFQARRCQRRPWQLWLLATVVCVDLWVAGKPVNSFVPREFFISEPESAQIMRQVIDGKGRLYRFPGYPGDYSTQIGLTRKRPPDLASEEPDASQPKRILLHAPTSEPLWMYRWDLEAMHHYLAAFYRLPVIFHEDYARLAQARMLEIQALLETLPWEMRLPFLSAGNVTHILTSDLIHLSGIQFIRRIPDRSNLPLYLYRNTRAARFVEFVTDWEVLDSEQAVLQRLQHPDVDPRVQVVLQTSDAEGPEAFQPGSCESATIEIQTKTSSEQTMTVSSKCDGVLVFSAPDYRVGRYASMKLRPQSCGQIMRSQACLSKPERTGLNVVTDRYRSMRGASFLAAYSLCSSLSRAF